MAQLENLKPPDVVRGMLVLDKKKFQKEISISTVQFHDVKISTVIPTLKKYLLKLDGLKPIQSHADGTVIYLNPQMVKKWLDIKEDDRIFLETVKITEDNIKRLNQIIGYENFTVDDVFKSVLPPENEGMASFTIIGHIVHVNLREHLLPFKSLIGQVLLDKVPGCKTVVNKIDMIDNTYRNFKMELLAGDSNMIAKLKENNCTFEFDFSTVYWNSRLCTEHERIVKKLKPSDVLFDVFAGVGPFSLPVAKKRGFVYANDLNPESFKWLNHNSKINKIDHKYLTTYNKDGRDFILGELREKLLRHINKQNVYITMNLPALAVEFLSSFHKLYHESELGEITNPPILFLYCFAKGEQTLEITKELVNKSMGWDISDKIVEMFKVRTVSSLKEMMRVSIKLDASILLGKTNLKRRNVEDDTCTCLKKFIH